MFRCKLTFISGFCGYVRWWCWISFLSSSGSSWGRCVAKNVYFRDVIGYLWVTILIISGEKASTRTFFLFDVTKSTWNVEAQQNDYSEIHFVLTWQRFMFRLKSIFCKADFSTRISCCRSIHFCRYFNIFRIINFKCTSHQIADKSLEQEKFPIKNEQDQWVFWDLLLVGIDRQWTWMTSPTLEVVYLGWNWTEKIVPAHFQWLQNWSKLCGKLSSHFLLLQIIFHLHIILFTVLKKMRVQRLFISRVLKVSLKKHYIFSILVFSALKRLM